MRGCDRCGRRILRGVRCGTCPSEHHRPRDVSLRVMLLQPSGRICVAFRTQTVARALRWCRGGGKRQSPRRWIERGDRPAYRQTSAAYRISQRVLGTASSAAE